jgi:uncharacterized repeat protein (TIGR03837 family)
MSATQSWDIFCKIVDNFGDIGVCWRLAKQLHSRHNIAVRVWVDDLHVAKRLIPDINLSQSNQTIDDINILHWHADADFSQAAEVVIEAFACGLPASYLNAMQRQSSKWVNLEYLTAEPWAQDFHAKPSPQKNGLTRHYYFPGFTPESGGLIHVGAHEHTKIHFSKQTPPTLSVSLFCYPHAAIAKLLAIMTSSDVPIHCYVPATSILPQVAAYFGLNALFIDQPVTIGQVSIEVLPFLSQDEYDALLAHCDINFVRGEDSWIRAIWAGNAFIWQPYLQEEGAHLKKLNAFLAQFYDKATTEVFSATQLMHQQWLSGELEASAWRTYLANLNQIKQVTMCARDALEQQADLASKLVIFCNNL